MSAVPVFTQPIAANDCDDRSLGLALPRGVAQAVWRGNELSHRATGVRPSGWAELDAELPGGGWPLQSVTEVLAAQPSALYHERLRPYVEHCQAFATVGAPLMVPATQEALDQRNQKLRDYAAQFAEIA